MRSVKGKHAPVKAVQYVYDKNAANLVGPKNQSWLRSWRCKVFSPKVWSLSAEQYRTWDMLLCLTDRRGYLPPLNHIAHHLRVHVVDMERRLAELVEMRFIDPEVKADGSITYRAHDWSQWQEYVDSSRERMQRLRKQRRDGGVTGGDGRVTEKCSVSVFTSLPKKGRISFGKDCSPSQEVSDANAPSKPVRSEDRS